MRFVSALFFKNALCFFVINIGFSPVIEPLDHGFLLVGQAQKRVQLGHANLKKNKTVEVNVEKNGKKENVKIGWRGVKVEDKDGTKVNIQFIPIFLFVLAILGTFLFFIYKVLELIVNW